MHFVAVVAAGKFAGVADKLLPVAAVVHAVPVPVDIACNCIEENEKLVTEYDIFSK